MIGCYNDRPDKKPEIDSFPVTAFLISTFLTNQIWEFITAIAQVPIPGRQSTRTHGVDFSLGWDVVVMKKTCLLFHVQKWSWGLWEQRKRERERNSSRVFFVPEIWPFTISLSDGIAPCGLLRRSEADSNTSLQSWECSPESESRSQCAVAKTITYPL